MISAVPCVVDDLLAGGSGRRVSGVGDQAGGVVRLGARWWEMGEMGLTDHVPIR